MYTTFSNYFRKSVPPCFDRFTEHVLAQMRHAANVNALGRFLNGRVVDKPKVAVTADELKVVLDTLTAKETL